MTQDITTLIGQKLIVGFWGTTIQDPWVRLLSQQIEEGKVGGIILFGYNIENPCQVRRLTHYFASLKAPFPLFITVDEEGGAVSRLSPEKGFPSFGSAEKVASSFSPEGAYGYYLGLATKVKEAGFNFNFGPVVDINPKATPASSIIGQKKRSFGETSAVISYAKAFIQAHEKAKVLTSLKHFPGHGSVLADSHEGIANASYWTEAELEPFQYLIKNNLAQSIMTAHITSPVWGNVPATFSADLLGKRLREQMGFQGVIISDDLHMGAIGVTSTLEEASLKSMQAGCDMLIFSNNPAAFGRSNQRPSPYLVEDIHIWAKNALDRGMLSLEEVENSADRINHLKQILS